MIGLGVLALVLIAVGLSFQKKPHNSTAQPVAASAEPGETPAPAVQAVYVPPLVKDLPDGARSSAEALGERLQEQFPAGTPVKTMTGALANQGFTVNKTDDANYHAELNGCKFDWKIMWSASEGKLAQISGTQESTCH